MLSLYSCLPARPLNKVARVGDGQVHGLRPGPGPCPRALQKLHGHAKGMYSRSLLYIIQLQLYIHNPYCMPVPHVRYAHHARGSRHGTPVLARSGRLACAAQFALRTLDGPFGLAPPAT